MRAIGLGGFCRHPAATAASRTSATPAAAARGHRVKTLRRKKKTGNRSGASEARCSTRFSSTVERSQFLLFCGSDTATSPAELVSADGTTLASRFAKLNAPGTAATQPVINRHMPVFFMPPVVAELPSTCRRL
uniref:Uncharacterized protein n=1 Tax=Hyaloperonospora arabidopsidis (strain Emoy2) TaxID=559515 RepID=M4B5F8_HYAAE